MKVLIVGAGLYGGLLGATLIEAGQEVTFLVGQPRQSQLIGRGLYISSPYGRFGNPVYAISSLAEAKPFDVVVIASRANIFQLGLLFAEDAIGSSTIIVPTFDGIHHLQHWSESYPENLIALMVFNIRANKDADGRIHQSGPCGDLRLGSISTKFDDRLKPLAAALNGRRFRTRLLAKSILSEMWAKHIFIAGAIGTAQLDNMTLKDSLRFGRRDLFKQLLNEGLAVVEAHGIRGVRSDLEPYRTGFQRESVPIQVPTPIAAGGRDGVEAASMLGTMLAKAQQVKVSTPALQQAWQSVSL
jgi:2-dehydropantoate 2-reductase